MAFGEIGCERLESIECYDPGRNSCTKVLAIERTEGDILPRLYISKTKEDEMTWISLALQSFIRTTPKRWSFAFAMGIGSPILFGTPTNAATSNSISNFLQGPHLGTFFSAFISVICPFGLGSVHEVQGQYRFISTPETTTEEARP